MKKLLALLLAGMMLLSLTSCNLTELLTTLGEMEDTGYEDEYSEETYDETPESTGPKIEESKTYTIYKEIWSGPYTMKYETYVKDFQDPNNQTVSSTTTIAVDGHRAGYVRWRCCLLRRTGCLSHGAGAAGVPGRHPGQG